MVTFLLVEKAWKVVTDIKKKKNVWNIEKKNFIKILTLELFLTFFLFGCLSFVKNTIIKHC